MKYISNINRGLICLTIFSSALLLLVSGRVATQAQQTEFQRIAPKVLPTTITNATPPVEKKVPQPTQVLVPKLKGLIFVRSISEVKATGEHFEGIQIDPALTILQSPEFKKKMQAYLNKPVSLNSLQELEQTVILYYREHDRPVVNVIPPAQDITGGVIQLVILEARVGTVSVTGNKWFNTDFLRSLVRLKPGDEISGVRVQSDLDWINRNPFRSTDLVYSPGSVTGSTNVALAVKDKFPFRQYGGYEDNGTHPLGENRFEWGFNWGNFLALDDQFNYQFTFDNDPSDFLSHSGVFTVPLPWRHVFTLFGSWVKSAAPLTNTPFGVVGKNIQVSERYDMPFAAHTFTNFFARLDQDFLMGFDFKHNGNNLQFGVFNVLNTPTDIFQFVLGYNARLTDKLGVTSFNSTVYLSPGAWGTLNTRTVFRAARAGARPRYAYAQIVFERDTKLPFNFTEVCRATGQIASITLVPSEELGVGGYTSVRGYEERQTNSDNGILLTNEIHAPPFSIGDLVHLGWIHDQFQFLIFTDFGWAINIRPNPGERNSITFWSAGPGVRYNISNNVTLRYDYGWQLLLANTVPQLGEQRGHVGITISY